MGLSSRSLPNNSFSRSASRGLCEVFTPRPGLTLHAPPLIVAVIALVSLLTLLPANLIVRQRPGWQGRGRPKMDWAAFRDVPYMLMMAGMFFSFWGIFFGFYYVRLAHMLPYSNAGALVCPC